MGEKVDFSDSARAELLALAYLGQPDPSVDPKEYYSLFCDAKAAFETILKEQKRGSRGTPEVFW